MPCCGYRCEPETTQTWTKELRFRNTWATQVLQPSSLGQEFKLYTVELIRHIGCCNEKYTIYVNDEEVPHHTLIYNPCSPLCCSGGSYEWEQDDHGFLLIFSNLTFSIYALGEFRLFIDGIDVNTDREFMAFWKRQGMLFMLLGLCSLIVGVTLSTCMLVFFARHKYLTRLNQFGVYLAIFGIIYTVKGCISFFKKYTQPRYRADLV